MAQNVDGERENAGPATKTAQNVDGGSENAGPATKMAQNVDGAGKMCIFVTANCITI